MIAHDQQNHQQTELIALGKEGNLGIVTFKQNAFEGMADLGVSEKFLKFLDEVESDTDISGLLILNEPGSFSNEAYKRFLDKALGKAVETHQKEGLSKLEHTRIRAREIHRLQNFILRVITFRKVTFMGLNGTIVTPFFGASLALDFRFASDDMIFSLAHREYQLHPSGALPFFLPQYLNRSKAVEILYETDEIMAKTALELGLINEIFPGDSFAKRCITEAKNMCIDCGSLIKTKKLMNYEYRDQLRRYFDIESHFVDHH